MAIERLDEAGRIQFIFGPRMVLHMPEISLENTEPQIHFMTTLELVDELALKAKEIDTDPFLSDMGRENRRTPVATDLVGNIARGWANLDNFDQSINKREAALLAVPEIHPQAAAVAVEDREIRDWWRGLSSKERAGMLDRITKSPEHQRIELALLRSPIKLLDHEHEILLEGWKRAKRVENPAEAMAIDNGRTASDWARRGMKSMAALSRSITKWEPERILSTLATDTNEHRQRGVGAFGFSIEHAKAFRARSTTSTRAV